MSEKVNIKPLDDKLVVQLEEKVKKTPGGIELPDTAQGQERQLFGKVLRCGPGRPTGELKKFSEVSSKSVERIPMQVKEGQRVVFARGSGYKIEVEEEEYVILSEAEILAVLE